ncbi:hypothetical protein GCM10027592_26060 [Spirosoma flavus]
MTQLKLKVYPSEFFGMIRFLQSFSSSWKLPLPQQSLAGVVLNHYVLSLKIDKIVAWKHKVPTKTHTLNLPLPVAKALYQELQATYIDEWQVMFLTKLDQAVMNLRLN